MLERLPYLRSTAVGIYVRAGSIMEEAHENGLSHFVEHMVFKGTKTKSARQIADEIDMIGGQVNAGTSKLLTSFYARTTDKDLERALRLLADLVMNPVLDPEDFKRERKVILEEIAMESDTPEDLVFNLAHQGMYGEQTLSRTILGSKKAISSYTIEELRAFRSKYYHPENTVLSVSGRFDPARLIAWAEEIFADWQHDGQAVSVPPNRVMMTEKELFLKKPIEQSHLCLCFEGLPMLHPDRYALMLLSSCLGGSVSSRLFQKIREDEGLVYTIYSAPSTYPDCGEIVVYAACSSNNINKVKDLIMKELHLMAKSGISTFEHEQAMAQMKTSYVLGMESAYSRMNAMGVNQLLHGLVIEPREVLDKMKKVKRKDVQGLAKTLFSKDALLAIVGDKKPAWQGGQLDG